MPFISVSNESEVKKIISSNKKVVVMYGASWCEGCNKAKPDMKKKSKSVSYPIVFVDVDKCGVIIDTIPAFAFIDSGKRVSYIEGDIDKVLSKCDNFGSDIKESKPEKSEKIVEITEYHREIKDHEDKHEKKDHKDKHEKKSKNHKHEKKDREDKHEKKSRSHKSHNHEKKECKSCKQH